ncbi:DNA topoisomerase 1 [Elasticomyces elasticus]|nr:DNA topoisomerase 1 [Elasticomyces elasticus]
MSSSDDDMPLARTKPQTNGVNGDHAPLSAAVISPRTDAALDKQVGKTNGDIQPGISIRNGPVTEEPVTNGKRKSRESGSKPKYAEESDSDDAPLSKKRKVQSTSALESDDEPLSKKTVTKRPPRIPAAQIGSDSDDVPLEKKLIEKKKQIEKKQNAETEKIKRRAKVKKEEDSDDEPLSKKAPAKKPVKKETKTTPKKGKVKKKESEEEEVEDDEVKWWEQPKLDGENKWVTLQHSGVVFPPPYEPLPKNVKMKYDGMPISMGPEAEEVASFFGAMLNSTHNVENPTFQKNFFNDFKDILKKTGGAKDRDDKFVKVTEFSKCDFKPIFEYHDAQRETKKALSKEEKKVAKAEKDEIEAPFLYCIWDGKKQKVGNFRVEPPGLFRGRGEHPKTGHVKKRVIPEQITINIGKEANVPAPPEGHKWKEIKHDKQGTWLAMWQENINGNYKYVMLAASADVKGQSDFEKFEKARRLKGGIGDIRKAYYKDLKAELMVDRQRATALYLIDKFAFRAGNEKSDDEADTVGCCSLKCENVTLKEGDRVLFDFLGKDSIRFQQEFSVDKQVFKNLRLFKKTPKGDKDDIFDRLETSQLNKHLQKMMPGLTAKVFRTFNASFTMAELMKEITGSKSVPEMIKKYNDANREVAILCNHKRTVTANHEASMGKMEDKVKGMRYQAWRLKQMMLDVDPKYKKKKGAEWFDRPEDLDNEWVLEHQAALVEEASTKITKKFEKDNEKLKAEGEKEHKPSELKERMEVVKDLEKKFKAENKSKKVEAEGKGVTVEKLVEKLEKLEQRIQNAEVQAEDKENNKEVALGTSKINYIDPRLSVVFCKKFNVPLEKVFSKTLRDKFEWAVQSVDEDWEF